MYTIGLDFGSLSVRGVLMDIQSGKVCATATYEYPHGIMTETLDDGTPLGENWVLQDPDDYWEGIRVVVTQILRSGRVSPQEIIGIGLDTTACTMLPTNADAVPLCKQPNYASNPHAYIKLWKHHAAQPYAERIQELAVLRREKWLERCGGVISCEHYLPKCIQIACEAPDVYLAADRLIQIGDWLVWKLTGKETRGYCNAAFKTFYDQAEGDVSTDFLRALHPLLENLNCKQPGRVLHDGCLAGRLTQASADWLGLCEGTAVTTSAVDAHVAVYGSHISAPNQMLMIVGTSACQIVMSETEQMVNGLNGIVYDAILPGYVVYEGGQSCVGDLFAWFVDRSVPAEYHSMAAAQQVTLHELLSERAALLEPGQSGLIALDWWNGVRSTLMDFDLSGLIIGLTLDTKPEDIYRALLESTAYGLRRIISSMENHGVRIDMIYATGGIAKKNPLMMQIYADVCGREIRIVQQEQTSALGSAILAAAAALHGDNGASHLQEMLEQYRIPEEKVFTPNLNARATYEQLYELYSELYNLFGIKNSLMKRLKLLKENN